MGPPAPAESFEQPMTSTVPRILVVDDDANQARVTAIGLRIEGFDVETAEDADGALGLLASRAFDLAVVDLMMPGTNGIQLARLLRERHPTTRVVLTSAYHLSERQLDPRGLWRRRVRAQAVRSHRPRAVSPEQAVSVGGAQPFRDAGGGGVDG